MMNKGRKMAAVLLVLVMALSLAACQKKGQEASGEAEKPELTVGCLARDEDSVKWIAEKLADKYVITPRVYSETVSIMQAAADGEDDLNYIASIPYWENYNSSYGGDLIFYKDHVTASPALFISQKCKSLEEIPQNGIIAVANDNASRLRELRFLQELGVLEYDENVEYPTVLDITSNPKNLTVNEIDARSRVGALPDYDALSIASSNFWMMDAGEREKCAILAQESDQACADAGGQGFCCLKENENEPWMEDIWKTACTKEFADWLLETYEGAFIPIGYYLQSGQVEYEKPTFEVPDIYE